MEFHLSSVILLLTAGFATVRANQAYNNNGNNGYSGGNNGYSNNNGNSGLGTGLTLGYGGCCYGFPDLNRYGSNHSPFYGGNDALNFVGALFPNGGSGGGNGYGGGYGSGNGNGNGGLGWYNNLRRLMNRAGGSGYGGSNGHSGSSY